MASPGRGSNPVTGQMRKLKPSKVVCSLRGGKLVCSNRTGLPTPITVFLCQLPFKKKKLGEGGNLGLISSFSQALGFSLFVVIEVLWSHN